MCSLEHCFRLYLGTYPVYDVKVLNVAIELLARLRYVRDVSNSSLVSETGYLEFFWCCRSPSGQMPE
jgi:hypothetical protein